MSINNVPASASAAAASGRASRIDITGPARPLGPKSAALHARRQQQRTSAEWGAGTRLEEGQVVLTSYDGSVVFTLKPSRFGLNVQRLQRQPLNAHVIQVMVFGSNDAFVRWCESDPIRFDHPVLYSQLRRHGDEAFPAKR